MRIEINPKETTRAQASAQCENICLDTEMMVIGTSAIVQTELDCIVNQYALGFNNPMVLWGRYHKGLFRTTLRVSFQFHHVQMDGIQGALFLEGLQEAINSLGKHRVFSIIMNNITKRTTI